MTYDYTRIAQLIDGTTMPENRGEEYLIAAYEHGSEGKLILQYMLEIAEMLDKFSIFELHLLLLGYALGQHDSSDSDVELAEILDKEDNGSTFH